MDTEGNRPLRIFYCSAHQDKKFLDGVEKHLKHLIKRNDIVTWHHQQIIPGAEWANTIDVQMETADIILLLVSPDFLSSDYCISEMHKALEKRKSGKSHVVPILLRPVDYKNTPLSNLQMLPRGGQAISRRANRDEIFVEVGQEISLLVETLLAHRREDTHGYNKVVDDEDLVSCEERLRLEPDNPLLHVRRGDILFQQTRFSDAFIAYSRAIELNPDYTYGYLGKIRVYDLLIQQCQEYIKIYEHLTMKMNEHIQRMSTQYSQGEF